MNLIIDVGNTRIKIAVFNQNKLIELETINKSMLFETVKKLLQKYVIEHGMLSSVGGLSPYEIEQLQSLLKLEVLNQDTKVPFINKYKTPKTLGVDRIALVSQAVQQFPNKNVLVIDAGTCITYDFVNHKSEYLGGAISLGLQMRYKALHQFTAKLPLLEAQNLDSFIGMDTQSSIHSGVINGVVNEIEGVIGQYRRKYENLTVVLTGGDLFFLQDNLKITIFAVQNFLLEGLNTLLIYNKK